MSASPERYTTMAELEALEASVGTRQDQFYAFAPQLTCAEWDRLLATAKAGMEDAERLDATTTLYTNEGVPMTLTWRAIIASCDNFLRLNPNAGPTRSGLPHDSPEKV